MESVVKSVFTSLKKEDEYFNNVIKKVTLKNELDNNELSYVLSLSILFCNLYHQTKKSGYFEFSYYLVLNYSLNTKDFAPLLDFSINNGFYPIASAILKTREVSINETIIDNCLNLYKDGGLIQLKEQKEKKDNLFFSDKKYRAYIAPTSYGKSKFIQEDINIKKDMKIGIIVPKKTLIWQVYKDIREYAYNNKYKILMHDTEYEGQNKIIGILTQERAIRLIEENDFYFDILYIDEAHNIFKRDERNILLSRLIRLNFILNNNQKIVYLSPLISDVNNLKIDGFDNIYMQKIEFNIKDYIIKFCDENGNISGYNRFTNEFYLTNEKYINWKNYLLKECGDKNLLYFYRPKDIEHFSREIMGIIPECDDKELVSIAELVSKYVDENYIMDKMYMPTQEIELLTKVKRKRYLSRISPKTLEKYLNKIYNIDKNNKITSVKKY